MFYSQGNYSGFGFKNNIIADLSILDLVFLGIAAAGFSQVGNNKVLDDTDKGLDQNDAIIKQNELLIKQNEEIIKLLKKKSN